LKLVKAIIRIDKVEAVKEALRLEGVTGLTLTEVRGQGHQRGHTTVYRGQEYAISLLPKMEIEVVVPDHWATVTCDAIIDAARTGDIGDGHIFVIAFEESYRIRTQELE
jgi:nitrogen regulatory protein PII